jgi:hypothetical protein
MESIETRHSQFVSDLMRCSPLGERARELRTMILQLERIKPELEKRRVAALIGNGSPLDEPEDDGLE